MKFLHAEDTLKIHEYVIESNELPGITRNKSIEADIARIDNRITYGLNNDEFELAACYACNIAVGHVFNEADKRTAFLSMATSLLVNEIELKLSIKETGDIMIKAARKRNRKNF